MNPGSQSFKRDDVIRAPSCGLHHGQQPFVATPVCATNVLKRPFSPAGDRPGQCSRLGRTITTITSPLDPRQHDPRRDGNQISRQTGLGVKPPNRLSSRPRMGINLTTGSTHGWRKVRARTRRNCSLRLPRIENLETPTAG